MIIRILSGACNFYVFLVQVYSSYRYKFEIGKCYMKVGNYLQAFIDNGSDAAVIFIWFPVTMISVIIGVGLTFAIIFLPYFLIEKVKDYVLEL